MNPIPTWPFVVGALFIGGAGGFALEHTIKSAEISEIKLTNANEITQASQVALEDYKTAAGVVTEAALGAHTDMTVALNQLAAIRKGQKNAPPPPLPDDCRPGPVRLRNLADTAAAADKAAARPISGH
jgi:hypothetical protein